MMLKYILSHLAICIILSPLSSQVIQFRGPDRTGIYHETGLLDSWPDQGPELVATISGIGDGFGSPAINEKGIYISGMIDSIGYIFHFDHDQQLKWKIPYGTEYTFKYVGARATPTLEQDRLYYSGTFGDAFCLDANNGTFLWKKNIFETFNGTEVKWGYTESPLLYQDLIILTPGGPGNNVVALNKFSGEQLWGLDLDSAKNAYCSPVIVRHQGEDLILMNTTRYLLLIHPLTGEIAYKHLIYHRQIMQAVTPVYVKDRIFYTLGYGEGSVLFKINEKEGRLDTLYHNVDLDSRMSGLILVDGTVFGSSQQKKHWVGIDLETGSTVFKSRELKPGSFFLADGKFFIFTEAGEVALAVPGSDGFTVTSKFDIPAETVRMSFSHPALYKGILYIRYKENLWLYKVGDS